MKTKFVLPVVMNKNSMFYCGQCRNCIYCRNKPNTLDVFEEKYRNTINYCDINQRDMGMVDIRVACRDYVAASLSAKVIYDTCNVCENVVYMEEMHGLHPVYDRRITVRICDECLNEDNGEDFDDPRKKRI